jgi:hypothetical protein
MSSILVIAYSIVLFLSSVLNILSRKVTTLRNGYNSLAPNSDAVLHAENWIVQHFLEVADGGPTWIQPNVIADTNGDEVFE